jgi:hypothetical protein
MLHRHSAHAYTTSPAYAMPQEPPALTRDELDDITAQVHRKPAHEWAKTQERIRDALEHWRSVAGTRELDRHIRAINREVDAAARRLRELERLS